MAEDINDTRLYWPKWLAEILGTFYIQYEGHPEKYLALVIVFLFVCLFVCWLVGLQQRQKRSCAMPSFHTQFLSCLLLQCKNKFVRK